MQVAVAIGDAAVSKEPVTADLLRDWRRRQMVTAGFGRGNEDVLSFLRRTRRGFHAVRRTPDRVLCYWGVWLPSPLETLL